ncbi:MAG: HDIG domain-containing protein [Spirochaetota bacterium]|nr:HDIG domain-containing protein [Spirochaetota bacterium]
MNNDRIPSIKECYELMRHTGMLPNIFDHSKQVMRVALAIVDNLSNETEINRDLVIAASLLHDITKTISIKTKEPHDITGGKYLKKIGFDHIACIVEEHVYIKDFNFNSKLTESEVVNYADKRVMHKKIVSVDERIADLVIRYGKTPEIRSIIINNKNNILLLESKISKYMKRDLHTVISDIEA